MTLKVRNLYLSIAWFRVDADLTKKFLWKSASFHSIKLPFDSWSWWKILKCYLCSKYVLRVVSKCHNYLLGGLDFVISLWRSLTFLSPHAECGIRLQNPLLLLRYILSLRVQSYCSCSLAQHEFSRIFCPGFFIHCAKTSTLVTLWMNIQKTTPFL